MLVGTAPALLLRGVLLAHDSLAAEVLAAKVDVALIDAHVATVRLIAHTHALKDLDISYSSRVDNGLSLSFIYDHCADGDIAGLVISNFLILIVFHVSLLFLIMKMCICSLLLNQNQPINSNSLIPINSSI